MRRASLLLVSVLCVVLVSCSRTSAPLPEALPLSPAPITPIELPRDALPHDALTEWWYFTGHLRADTDRREYGFEFTIFQARRQDAPTGYLAHFAISDIAGQRFAHAARVSQGAAADGFPIDVDGWTLASMNGVDGIQAQMQDFALRLELVDEKPPALHHGGFIDYGALGGSHYYSRTRLRAAGVLNGADVSGLAWMDHQWGDFVVSSALVWDWYSVQLEDRTELMLYVLRSATGSDARVYASRILADGSVEDLPPSSVRIDALSHWTSPHTGGVYPSGWRLLLPDGTRLELRPTLLDQELYFPENSPDGFGTLPYWEGAVSVTGDRTGVGYVELTGYAGR